MAHNIEIEKSANMRILVTDGVGGSIKSQTVEANILFAILEKLEEIRCGIIDVESAVEHN